MPFAVLLVIIAPLEEQCHNSKNTLLIVVPSIFNQMKDIQQMLMSVLLSCLLISLHVSAADGYTKGTITHTYPNRRKTGVAYK
jgi:hypothetical protein